MKLTGLDKIRKYRFGGHAQAAEFLTGDNKEHPARREKSRAPVQEDESDDLMTFALLDSALDLF